MVLTGAKSHLIANPTGDVAATGGQWIFYCGNDGAGNSLVFDSDYHTAGGAQPPFSDGAGDINIYFVTRLYNNSYLVSAATDVKQIVY